MTLLSIVEGGLDPDSAEAAWSRYLAENALLRGEQVLPQRFGIELRLAVGHASDVILDASRAEGATLVALSGYEAGRAKGPLAGELVARMLMRAHCSLLVARRTLLQAWPPRTIVVGIDGSRSSFRALATARALADRLGAELRPLAAIGGSTIDRTELQAAIPDLAFDRRRLARALCDAAHDADLVIVGQGADRLLGAPSTIVALAAVSSVLVIREHSPIVQSHSAREGHELPLALKPAA